MPSHFPNFLIMPKQRQLSIGPIERASGVVSLPGSKSISNRALLLAALAEGTTRLRHLLDCDDTRVMMDSLHQLGVRWHREQSDVIVEGCGGSFRNRSADLFVENSGTTMRFLAATLALQGGAFRLSGAPRMHERPIKDLIDSLRSVGADIRYEAKEGYPPLAIAPAVISLENGIEIDGGTSSQYLTALLIALASVSSTMEHVDVRVSGELISKPYVRMTLDLLSKFSVAVKPIDQSLFRVPTNRKLRTPGILHIEGDASSASYFLAAGAIGCGPVRVEGVGRASTQGDIAFADALTKMGASINVGDHWIEASRSPREKLRGISIDCNHMPDAAMTLAMVALFAEGETCLKNIGSWRVKETDRLSAMATDLRKLGADADEGDDYLRIRPPRVWCSPKDGVDTYDDHRMAMCFSLAAFGPSSIVINDPDCVSKTFPAYFDVFPQISQTT